MPTVGTKKWEELEVQKKELKELELLAERWFKECWMRRISKKSLLYHLLCSGYKSEEYLECLDAIETGMENKEYYLEEKGEAPLDLDRMIAFWQEKMKNMEKGWNPDKDRDMAEEWELVKMYEKRRRDFLNGLEVYLRKEDPEEVTGLLCRPLKLHEKAQIRSGSHTFSTSPVTQILEVSLYGVVFETEDVLYHLTYPKEIFSSIDE